MTSNFYVNQGKNYEICSGIARKAETYEVLDKTLNEIQERVRSIIKLTLDLYANGRNLVRRLRPEVLDMLGLQGAIEEMLG